MTTYFTYVLIFIISVLHYSFVTSASVYVTYILSYENTESTNINIQIQFTNDRNTELQLRGPQIFIMPRAIPSGYNLQFYDLYVENLIAKTTDESIVPIKKDSTGGPRWILECTANQTLSNISYSINLTKHEKGILSGGDSSKIRLHQYISILGYSVFGYLEQMDNKEDFPIMLIIHRPSDWPIHCTLVSGVAKNYYHLADSQIYMGPNLIYKYASIPFDQSNIQIDNKLTFKQEQNKTTLSFYVIIYTEDVENLNTDMVFNLSVQAMRNLLIYYDTKNNNTCPFLFYTVGIEMITPLDDSHTYGFSMEHLYSCTIDIQYGTGINKNSTQDNITRFQYNLAHHIQHAWIPKRLFSTYYYPFTFELPPVIDTIWFNEGFGQYLAMDAMANVLPSNESEQYRDYLMKNRFEYFYHLAPLFIQQMPLKYLSTIASSFYAIDFRTGSHLFARGALMARDIDDWIQSKTQKQKSLRDGIVYMIKWSECNSYKVAFTMEQFPMFFLNATDIDITPVLNKWL
ncbi:hypothetical protein I4U23_004161 [Adineta vaga]|nr:hypothetical protein I4U23_004161 [Adineta vaga]